MDKVLNLPQKEIKMRDNEIWDRLRKKFVRHTPEEWVRQHFINYLIDYLNFPEGRMVSEHAVAYNGMKKRCDIAVFGKEMNTQVIVECKAPHIPITEDTFYQIAKYCFSLKANLLVLTNGMEHYCAQINSETGEMKYLPEIPDYKKI